MKTVILVRHAKSDWSNPSLSDFDRPLNERGKRDAPIMAERLKEKLNIEKFISSPAKRAARTAKIFAKAFNQNKKDILFVEKLYLAEPETFFSVIANTDDKYNCIAIFSHNFGITDFANMLTDTRIDNIPTSSVFATSCDIKSWGSFETAPKEFLFFDSPALARK